MKNNEIKYINNDFTVIKCSNENIGSILDLQDRIFETINDVTWLRKNSKEMFLKCLEEPNVTFGLKYKDKLIALIILYGLHDSEDLGPSLLNHSVDNSANFKLILVDKEYRGNRFMKALMFVLERYAYKKGFTHLCATVSPYNNFSYENMKEMGYERDCTANKYNGLERDIYVKDIKKYQDNYLNEHTMIKYSRIKEKSFKGSIDIANYGDLIESNNVLYMIKKNNELVTEEGKKKRIEELNNISVWINTNL